MFFLLSKNNWEELRKTLTKWMRKWERLISISQEWKSGVEFVFAPGIGTCLDDFIQKLSKLMSTVWKFGTFATQNLRDLPELKVDKISMKIFWLFRFIKIDFMKDFHSFEKTKKIKRLIILLIWLFSCSITKSFFRKKNLTNFFISLSCVC